MTVLTLMDDYNIVIEAHPNEMLRDQAAAAGMRFMRLLARGSLLTQEISVYAAVDDEGAAWRVAAVGSNYALWEEEDPDGFSGLIAIAGLAMDWEVGEYPICTVYSLYEDGLPAKQSELLDNN